MEMEKRYGLYIVLGLAFGAVYGIFLGKAIGDMLCGVALGALGGTFVGWFVAAAVRERSKGNPKQAAPDKSTAQE